MATTATVKLLKLGPDTFNVEVTRRDSFTFGWNFEDDDGPVDFLGDAFQLTVNAQSDGGGSAIFAIANSNTPDATSGLVEFTPSIVNLTQTPAKYFYDLQWDEAGGDVRTILKGTFEILEDIST